MKITINKNETTAYGAMMISIMKDTNNAFPENMRMGNDDIQGIIKVFEDGMFSKENAEKISRNTNCDITVNDDGSIEFDIPEDRMIKSMKLITSVTGIYSKLIAKHIDTVMTVVEMVVSTAKLIKIVLGKKSNIVADIKGASKETLETVETYLDDIGL